MPVSQQCYLSDIEVKPMALTRMNIGRRDFLNIGFVFTTKLAPIAPRRGCAGERN